eukprot:superscaffoldBa00001786_g12015
MLLPSDVARLVLGYLQEEGLSDTSQAFIHESPNLKEYAEHTTGDGTIPACVFSVFGKGLTTILNEYVAAKTKARSRIGVANMARQRILTLPSSGSVVCSTVSETGSIISPVHTSHSMLGHSTPVSFTGPHTRVLLGSGTHPQIHDGSRILNSPRDSPMQIIVSEHRINPGPMSPGRRKCEPTPQTSKAPSSTVEADQSIDEILGLQGEIHMSDDAIHDILEQTESDPAFQALFDLFDYNKTKFTDGEPGDGDISSSPEESDTAGPSSTVIPLQSDPVTAASDPVITNHSAPSKAAGDSSNIVSLKIIISDNQDENSATDTALNQAVPSISGDKIPTIYLSSPAKSPRCPGTPKANLDETAQAVSGLQSSEAQANPLSSSKAGAVVASPLTGTSQAQQSYIIQLPLDATNPTLQGATASYFLVTEPPTNDAQARQVLVPAGVSKGQPFHTSSQYGVTTPNRSKGYPTGSPLILPSPIKPMMLPVSVMGQNTLSKVQMVSNQLVAIPKPVSVQQPETVKPKPSTVAVKQSTAGGSSKDKDESSRKEPAEKGPAKSREGRTEKRTPSQEMPNVMANKENEMKGSLQEQQQSTPSSSAPRDFSPSAVTQTASNPQSKAAKAPSKTSSLAKQAAEMLQGIQGLNSPSTPVKRPGVSGTDLTLPRTPATGRNQEESIDCSRTPSRQKMGKDGEGTPKNTMPPNTPDVPSCSPASEAGSENCINMAAHTLMILSRAAIARTGTPLKDSLRQEGVSEKSPTSSKNSKKRKQSSPTASPPSKKDSKQSPGKKKDREKKKLIDCFPHDLDVDKFLSSLHYDE